MGGGTVWVDRVQELVRWAAEQAPAAEQVPDHRDPVRRLTQVLPEPGRGPGWFVATSRLTSAEVENIGAGYLRPDRDPRPGGYRVLEVVVAGEQVRVRTSATAPATSLDLYAPAEDQRQILISLADGLRAVRDNPLLTNFADRTLTPVPRGDDLRSVPAWSSLRRAQRHAVAACCAPGLHLVWGPPGTGKTRVIAAAISHLARSGRRVLLVSATNVAVDAATEQVIRMLQPEAGEVVRIGAIHRPAVAANARVNLSRLIEDRQREPQQRAAGLEAQLQGLRGADEELTRAQVELAGFDAEGYQQASRRVAHRNAFERTRRDLSAAEKEFEAARTERERCQRLLLALACREAAERADNARTAIDSELATLTGLLWMAGRNREPIRRFRATRLSLTDEVTRAESALQQALDEAARAGVEAGAGKDLSGKHIRAEYDVAVSRVRAAQSDLNEIRRDLDQLRRRDLAGPAETSIVEDQRRLWQLRSDLPELRTKAEQEHRRRASVELEYERLRQRITQDRAGLEEQFAAGARVVATTLAQIARHPWITRTPFDQVVADEAVAASFPQVVHAVGCAKSGAVLVGDYLQNGPPVSLILPAPNAATAGLVSGPDPGWIFSTDCFGFFAVTNPVEVQTRPGCVVLTEQFRFGPAITELANRIGYEGVLETIDPGRTEIVVITVDGLPSTLRTIVHGDERESGRWAIGPLLARALAEHHHGGATSDAVAVLTPHPVQAETIRAALADSSAECALTPVGTSSAFQGRQFDTVLIDLVEDGDGWVAQARGQGQAHALDGLRLFNVAATRPRERLFVLLTHRALESATGGPLVALRHMIATGTAERVEVATLLSLSEDEAPPERTAAAADLLTALQPYLRTAGRHDPETIVEEVVSRINAARASVWCWNAWSGQPGVSISDALEGAHRRGVEVHVIARPPGQVPPSERATLEGLAARLPQVVFMRDLAEKIVVTDQEQSLIGSLKSSSPARTSPSRDYLIMVDGARFAGQLLAQEMATELGARRRCPACGEPLRECGQLGPERNRHWAWLCINVDDRGNRHRLPFPAAPSPA